MNLKLLLQEDGEVTLPAGLCAADLSLDELGTLLILACITEGSNGPAFLRWLVVPGFASSMKSLIDKKVIAISVVDGRVKLDVDFDRVPMRKPEAEG